MVETEGAGCAKAAPLQGRIHTFGCAELASAEREVIMRPHSMQGVSLSVSPSVLQKYPKQPPCPQPLEDFFCDLSPPPALSTPGVTCV